ncbi:MAG: PAS domain S-box protein [Salinibacter sp.]
MDDPNASSPGVSDPPRPRGPLTVLLIEDNPGDARLFAEHLSESRVEATVRHERTLRAGRAALRDEAPDVLVVDLGLPDSEGAATIEAVVAAAPSLPIVVVTGQDSLEAALDAQRAGAAEYLQKSNLSPALVGRTLRWAAQRHRMREKLRQRDAWIRSITESVSTGIFRVGATGRIEYANDALANLLGAQRAAALEGQDLSTFFADSGSDDRVRVEDAPDGVEVAIERADGSRFPGLLSAEATRNADGEAVHYDGTLTDITDQKNKEQRLRVLSEAIEQASESVLITEAAPLDPPGPRITYVNAAFEEMTGYAQEEIQGRTPRLLQGEKTDRDVLDSIRAALEAGETWAGEAINYRKDGTPYRVQWNLAPVRGTDGTIEHWVSVQRDVTEERRRDERLRLLARALDQVGEKVFITDPDGHIQYVNDAFEDVTGYSEDDVLGNTPALLRSTAHDDAFYDELWATIQSGAPFRAEVVNQRADGSTYVEDETISSITDEEGTITHFVSAGRDVTEKKERVDALRRTTRLLRLAQDMTGIGGWSVDLRDGPPDEATWTDGLYDLFGLPPDADPPVEDVFSYYHPDDRARHRAAVDRAADTGEGWDQELRLIDAEGTLRWVRNIGRPVVEDGTVVEIHGAIQDITEQKAFQEELRRSRERLQMAVEAGTIGTWDWDLETGRVVFNRQWAEMLGYDRDELDFHFSTWEDLTHPDDLDRALEALDAYVDGTAEAYAPEIRMRTKSGRWKWIQTIGKVVNRDEDGTATRTAGVHLDIDERKRAEQALQEREARLRGLANSIPGVIFQFDAQPSGDYGFTFVGEKAEEMLGLAPDPETFLERSLSRVPSSHRTAVQESIETAVTEQSAWNQEFPFERPSGETIWLWGLATPEQKGETVVFSGVLLDNTKRKNMEREVRHTKTFYEQVFDQIPIDLAVFDREAQFEYLNAGSVGSADRRDRIIGWTNEEYCRRRGLDPALGRRRDEAIREVIETGETVVVEETLETGEGPRHYRRVHGPITDSDGHITHVAGYGIDVTDQKQYEQQLREAKAAAEKAARLKSAMLANMSHEIRTPLTSILGFSEAIGEETRGASPEDIDLEMLSEFSDLIEKSGRRLMDTLTGVLNLSKLEAGEMTLSLTPIDLSVEAHEAVDEFRPQAAEADLSLTTDIEAGTCARADKGGLHIIFRNLLSNAIKYTAEGGQVEVRVRDTAEHAVLEVEDTGAGMDPEEVSEFFQAFKQGSEGMSRKYEGTGLGLTIVNRMVERMNGAIEVETEEGVGTCFTVRLVRAPTGSAPPPEAPTDA